MNYFTYTVKFLYRIKWWLILCPLAVAMLIYIKMGTQPRMYKSTTTIYTGIVSGYDIETIDATQQDWNTINNAMDNMISIIRSQSTLKNVSMQLYARSMMNGDTKKDNNYILSRNYRSEVAHTPKAVLDLIDRNDEQKTLDNLANYETADHSNHVYGLFHWNHHYYSYEALSRMQVKRIGTSDMLEISYENDDPGMVYNTLELLNKEFVLQYQGLRFGPTNNVIKFFETALKSEGQELRNLEDSLRDYNIENRIINYDEQTKHIAALDRDFELYFTEIMRNIKSAESLAGTIEGQITELRSFRNNAAFVQKLNNISDLHTRIATNEAFLSEEADNKSPQRQDVNTLKEQLVNEEKELQQITVRINEQQYSKEGIATNSLVQEWLNAVLLHEKSKAELEVIKDRRDELDKQYSLLSPVGATLKRKGREINFSEQSYLAMLQALNTARLRQKNLEMSSATLRVLNAPVLPISAEPSKRKLMVFASAFATFCFVFGIFVLLEILDRTLRDRMRTERITRGQVLGALPSTGTLGQRKYVNAYQQAASTHIANAILNYFSSGSSNIINILSTESGDGKSFLADQLADQLREKGMKVRVAMWGRDFDIERKEFILAEKLSDFIADNPKDSKQIPMAQADIIIIEYPAFQKNSVSRELLRLGAINILVAAANRTWKDTDQMLFEKAVALSGNTPICICLNYVQRNVLESFTGLLPPFTTARKIGYRISQFGFTAVK